MNIILLDDDKVCLSSMRELITSRYAQTHNLTEFYSFEDLYEAIGARRLPAPDIAFLDIRLQSYDGMTAAMVLKAEYPLCKIVYFTGYAESYIDQLFDKIRPSGFLRKPIVPQRLYYYIDMFAEQNGPVTLNVRNRDIQLPQNSIMFAEHSGRVLLVTTTTEVFSAYIKTEDFYKKLNDRFVRCHNSFIVNMSYVADMTKNEFVMMNGRHIAISRKYRDETRERYLLFKGFLSLP